MSYLCWPLDLCTGLHWSMSVPLWPFGGLVDASVCEICNLSQQSGCRDIMLCGVLFMMPGLLWSASPLSTFISTHILHGLQETSSSMCAVSIGVGHGAETNKRLRLVVCVSSRLCLEKQAISTHVLECFFISMFLQPPVEIQGWERNKRKTLPHFFLFCPHFSRVELGELFISHVAGTFPVSYLEFSLQIVNLMVKSTRLAFDTLFRI